MSTPYNLIFGAQGVDPDKCAKTTNTERLFGKRLRPEPLKGSLDSADRREDACQDMRSRCHAESS